MEALKRVKLKSTYLKNLEDLFIMVYESGFNDFSMID